MIATRKTTSSKIVDNRSCYYAELKQNDQEMLPMQRGQIYRPVQKIH